jgi:carbon starvation protein
MSAIMLLITAVCIFVLAYRYYSAFIAAKVLMLDDRNVTPAVSCNDGHDYVPTNKWIVFGHHFAAIAGAGPLIGPVLAAQYGWGPGAFWIILGSVFAGAVHDFIILFASLRHKGQSLATIAKKEVGPITGTATAIAVLFIIVVALAGLAIAVVNALFNNAWGTFTLAATIPIAIVIGLYMFRLRPGAIVSGSIAGFILVCAAVFLGHDVALSSFGQWFMFDKKTISVILPVYGFAAAALPVWLLLAPRDYLSTYMKIGVVGALAIGLFFVNPQIQMPFTTKFIEGGGPIIPGPAWPYVFITIACGAISGFHALIGSGTTPKMMEHESEARMIGYGSMLTEGFVALMALIAATTLIPADYFAINTSAAVFQKLQMKVVELPELSKLVGMDIAGRPGGAVSLAVGMANIFASLPGMKHMMSYWYQFIIMFEALFILTTIDAGTRVARYILQDILGNVYTPFKNTDWIFGSIITSALVSFGWGYMVYTGDIASIWPMFGTANQLLAVLALCIGTTIILKIGTKKNYSLVTAVPMSFLAVTVISAAVMNVQMYLTNDKILNAGLSVMLIVLVGIIIIDNARLWLELLKKEKPVGMNDQREVVYCPVIPPGNPPDVRP